MSTHCCPMCRGAIGSLKTILYQIKEKSFLEIFDDEELQNLNNADLFKLNYAQIHEDNRKLKEKIAQMLKDEKSLSERHEKQIYQKDQDIVKQI
jgi:hypothetical protein